MFEVNGSIYESGQDSQHFNEVYENYAGRDRNLIAQTLIGCGETVNAIISDQVISRDGTPIAYQRSGTGPPLVLVHGAGASPINWTVFPALTQHFTVYAVDRRGSGAGLPAGAQGGKPTRRTSPGRQPNNPDNTVFCSQCVELATVWAGCSVFLNVFHPVWGGQAYALYKNVR